MKHNGIRNSNFWPIVSLPKAVNTWLKRIDYREPSPKLIRDVSKESNTY
jgi:hypothetical protein